ncbi:Homeobox domain-containing protein [Plasmodiophora brassicae]
MFAAFLHQSLLSVTPRICRHEEFTCDDVNFRIDVFYQTLMENLKGAFDTSRKRKRPTTRASTVTGDSTPAEATSKRRQRLPLSSIQTLQAWFTAHIDHPYPTEDEKLQICEEAGITMKQLINWFTNTRKRIWSKNGKDNQGRPRTDKR